MSKNRRMHWATALALFVGFFLVNGCGQQANPSTTPGQQLTGSIKLDPLSALNECTQKGRYTSCWHRGNHCVWYDNILNNETRRNGLCMLNCSNLKSKETCNNKEIWHCEWDVISKKCTRNRFETKEAYEQDLLSQKNRRL
ncbi:MAG: hypothetical protein AAF320_04580 [Myxococcota bacterium]